MTIRRVRVCNLFVFAVLAFGPAWIALGQQAVLDKFLFDASWRGNAEEVARVLKAGAKPNVVTNRCSRRSGPTIESRPSPP